MIRRTKLNRSVYEFLWHNGHHHRSLFSVDEASQLAARYIRTDPDGLLAHQAARKEQTS